jgi:hypothetical protein
LCRSYIKKLKSNKITRVNYQRTKTIKPKIGEVALDDFRVYRFSNGSFQIKQIRSVDSININEMCISSETIQKSIAYRKINQNLIGKAINE